ncbi:M56 family metallopeptidase [Bacteroidota bacterium]
MNDFLLYMIQASISMALFYGIYWLFLRKETYFHTNRFYLNISLIISALFPLFDYTYFLSNITNNYIVMLDPITITAKEINDGIQYNLSTFQVILIIYFTGLTIFSIRFLYQIFQLARIAFSGKVKVQNGVSYIISNKHISPFSFFNYIFLSSEELNQDESKGIIAHEKVHIKQKHSIDIILLEFFAIAFWFNPFIWLYKKSVKTIHEYLADEGVLTNGYKRNTYQSLLLNQTLGIQINDLTNSFNHSLIKRRFIMMTKSRSGILARFKILLIVPTALIVLFVTMAGKDAMAQQTKTTEKEVQKSEQGADKDVPPPPPKKVKTSDQQEKDDVFIVVEEMPEYPGGREAMYKFLSENVKYPKEAIKAGVTGTVFVTFVVEKDGSVSETQILATRLDPKDASQDIKNDFSESSLNVLHKMPKWKPGKQGGKAVRVKYNLPIRYNLDEGAKKKEK